MLWILKIILGSRIKMVKIGIQFKCRLENITGLQPDGDDFRYYVKLKCASCGDETPEFVYFCSTDCHPLKGGRGEANMVLKCKLCQRENSICIYPDTISSYDAEHSEHFKTIAHFDCRGVEITEFSPRAGYKAEGEESGTKFTDITLTDGEWCEYDDKAQDSVGIYEIESQFVKIK